MEQTIVKMNKMIHKKTGASFLVVYVIYVSLVYTDRKKTESCLLSQHTIFATFGRQLKCLLVRISLVSITLQMPRPRHKYKAIIRVASHPLH